jgi:hypothetical protein
MWYWYRGLPNAVVIVVVLIVVLIGMAVYGYMTGAWEPPTTGE